MKRLVSSMRESFKETLINIYSVFMALITTLAVTAILALIIGIRPKILTTDSMYPSIYRGSLVLVNVSFAWDSIEEGDVIAFRSGSTEVMHRVTQKTVDHLVLKPDNGQGENLVTRDMYAGKEIIAFPYIGGMIKLVLQRGKGIVILLAVIMIVIGCMNCEIEKITEHNEVE